MSKAEWEAIYREAWETYYTPAHALTIFRRAAATGMGLSRLLAVLFIFSAALRIETVHPLQVGGFRLKSRRDRRPGLPIEPAWSFWPKYLLEIVAKHVLMAKHWIDLDLLRRRARREQARRPYTDVALTPVTDEETETLDMFTHSEDARRSVAHVRKVDALIHPAAQPQQHIVAAE